MSKLNNIFELKKSNVLNIYCTAGYPYLNSTVEVIKALENCGADIIELGIPYSDPLADGPTIQASSSIALANGMSIEILFSQLETYAKKENQKAAIILMGYLNPILQFGFEEFCKKASRLGIDGLIIPDLPEYEFENEYGAIIKKHGLDFIFLVTPETSEQRVKKLDSLSSGFLYAVSSSSVTGSNKNFDEVESYLKRLESYKLKTPVLVGFGITDAVSYKRACKHTNGGIIGTAYIKALENCIDIFGTTQKFIDSIKG